MRTLLNIEESEKKKKTEGTKIRQLETKES